MAPSGIMSSFLSCVYREIPWQVNLTGISSEITQEVETMADANFVNEINKRRTFAIISHPDATQPFNA